MRERDKGRKGEGCSWLEIERNQEGNREGGRKNELGTLIFSLFKRATMFFGKSNPSQTSLNFVFEFGMEFRERKVDGDFRFGEFWGW